MQTILIKNGRVIDPSRKLDRVVNVLLRDGKVAALDVATAADAFVIDATDRIVVPGLIDLNTQLREPGFEEDETIRSGTAAALAGGYTTIACLASTDPPIDSQASVEFVQHQAARANHCRVVVIACVSQARAGEQLAEMGSLAAAGAVAFSDAPRPVLSAELMRRALEYGSMFNLPIINRPEVRDLTRDGVMHEGQTSLILGLAGMPPEAEDVMTARDLRLAESTGGRLHLTCLSTRGSVELVRNAKKNGISVTADVCPLNFTLTDQNLRTFDSRFKVNPPLRSHEHVTACIAALKDGTIDAITSSHSPYATEKKMQELDMAPFGAATIETVLSLVITHLIEPGHLTWSDAIEKLSTNPARILNLSNQGTLENGSTADVTVIDPSFEWQVDAAQFFSQGRYSPYDRNLLRGRAQVVIVDGQIRWDHQSHTSG